MSVPGAITPFFYQPTQLGEFLPGTFSPTVPKGVRGYGVEAFADPYGAGGPLTVARAAAVGAQTVRVSFSEEPAHFSAASLVDGLNPGNYFLAIVSGQAVVPNPVGVLPFGPGPGLVVRAGEWGMDVRLDRPLARGVRYRIQARGIVARAGLGLGYPYAAEFMGATLPEDFRPKPRRQDMADFATDTATGAWVFDDSGDVAVDGGLASYRKRVIRRALTPKGAYSFLGNEYGTILALKRPISIPQVGVLKADMVQQIRREPETQDVAVQAIVYPLQGILDLSIFAKARQGSLQVGLTKPLDGGSISIR